MKTIAISIDEESLEVLDEMARQARRPGRAGRRPGGKRSALVRQALRDFILRHERERREERERAILASHRGRLARQAKALVGEQAPQ